MLQNDLFLSPAQADKQRFVEMITATAQAIADSLDHSHAYAGMPPYELRAALHTDELLPEKSCSYAELLTEVEKKILPNLVRPMSTDYMAHLHSPALLESIAAELIIDVRGECLHRLEIGHK